MEDFLYDLRSTSAVLVCSVKWGQQDYGNLGICMEGPSVLWQPHGAGMVSTHPPFQSSHEHPPD